ncbi:hypothetical protein [Acidiphilium iwatense]|uniref:Uncharacterized protein n=1 Tax=Acidiphilium iwatense TaxID=768198 RepID=A0ABS9DZT5_9PROT|nr:hypothetical protein [Acidiphilium iwatense]MCF3948270.1 hypothetical protein [Acidiphilium iwatense]
MASDTTQRVKRHRIERGVVRVEVEVPTAEDAAAVRRFARERRESGRQARPAASPTDRHEDAGETLADLIDRIGPNAMPALRVFAAGLATARTPELIARAGRIARNYADVARMQDYPSVRVGKGRGD